MLSPLLMWHKIARIALSLSKRLDVTPFRALDIFYTSQVCNRLHDPQEALYTFSDEYIVDELMMELRGQGY